MWIPVKIQTPSYLKECKEPWIHSQVVSASLQSYNSASPAKVFKSPNAESMVVDTLPNNPEAVAAIEQKYVEERNKRLRENGSKQYIDLTKSEKFKGYQQDPWVDPNVPPVATLQDGDKCGVLILGAGFTGILSAVRLIDARIGVDDIRIVDSAGGFGGTWYWNRYPGLMCDVESYIYMPILEEMEYVPKHRYAYGPELRAYAESIAKKYELEKTAMFQTDLTSMSWDDNEMVWVVKMVQKNTGKKHSEVTVRANFVITAAGVLTYPKLSGLPGIADFKGHSFHTSRWDYTFTGGSPADPSLINLKDKKVGFLGTGATAVQAVPHVAKWAKELYVFQRTPSAVDRRDNRPTDLEAFAREISTKKGWQRARQENFNAQICNVDPVPEDMVSDGFSKLKTLGAIVGMPKTVTPDMVPAHIADLHAKDIPRQERVRERVEETIKEPSTAEKLKAWYPSWCKRPCFHDDYLPSFNQPNVHLIDTDGKGVSRITENGILVGDIEYKLDVLIYGTGFRAPAIISPGSFANLTVKGRNGRSMDDKWTEGVATLHGISTRDFPNYFFPGPFQAGAAANYTFISETFATHIAYIISEANKRAGGKYIVTVEPTTEAEEGWSMQVLSHAATFAAVGGCTPSYFNMEGEVGKIAMAPLEVQMKMARGSGWGRGIADYVGILEGWRQQGELQGLEIIPSP